MAARTMMAVDPGIHAMAKAVATRRGEKLQHYTDSILRPYVSTDFEALGDVKGEPLSYEAIAFLVDGIRAKTGETREECLMRLLGKAAMEDFAARCCPAEELAAVS